VLDIHPTALGRVAVSRLDERLIEKNLAVHPHLDCSALLERVAWSYTPSGRILRRVDLQREPRIVGTPAQRQRRAADAHDLDFSGNFNRAALALPRIMRAAENRPAVGAYVRTAEISSKAAAARAHYVTK